jgi:hypothetical protein
MAGLSRFWPRSVIRQSRSMRILTPPTATRQLTRAVSRLFTRACSRVVVDPRGPCHVSPREEGFIGGNACGRADTGPSGSMFWLSCRDSQAGLGGGDARTSAAPRMHSFASVYLRSRTRLSCRLNVAATGKRHARSISSGERVTEARPRANQQFSMNVFQVSCFDQQFRKRNCMLVHHRSHLGM